MKKEQVMTTISRIKIKVTKHSKVVIVNKEGEDDVITLNK